VMLAEQGEGRICGVIAFVSGSCGFVSFAGIM